VRLSALLITLSWRSWVFLSANVDTYMVTLPVLDSLVGVLFTFLLGFSMNFYPEYCLLGRGAAYFGAALRSC